MCGSQGSGAMVGINLGLKTCYVTLHYGDGCIDSGNRSNATSGVDGTGDRGNSAGGLEGCNISRDSGHVVIDLT